MVGCIWPHALDHNRSRRFGNGLSPHFGGSHDEPVPPGTGNACGGAIGGGVGGDLVGHGISQMSYRDESYGIATYSANGKPRAATGDKTPERTGWELLGWAVLERAVDDLAIFCRAGLLTKRGKCMPWPFHMAFHGGYWCRIPAFVDYMRGPNDHEKLKAWFHSEAAQEFCDLIGCRLPAAEIFSTTVRNHGK